MSENEGNTMKLTKAFQVDLIKLADKIWLGKIEPMEALVQFYALTKKHYGDADFDVLCKHFSMYLQIYTFSRVGQVMDLLLSEHQNR